MSELGFSNQTNQFLSLTKEIGVILKSFRYFVPDNNRINFSEIVCNSICFYINKYQLRWKLYCCEIGVSSKEITSSEFLGSAYDHAIDRVMLFHYFDSGKSTNSKDGFLSALLHPPLNIYFNEKYRQEYDCYMLHEIEIMTDFLKEYLKMTLGIKQFNELNDLDILKWELKSVNGINRFNYTWGSYIYTVYNSLSNELVVYIAIADY